MATQIETIRRTYRRRDLDAVVAVVGALGVLVGTKLVMDLGSSLSRPIVVVVGVMAAVGMGLLALVRFEWFVLVVLGARATLDYGKGTGGRADPASAVAVLFMAAGLLWLATARRSEPGEIRLTIPFGIFLTAAALSVVSSQQPAVSLLELMRMGAVMAMLLVLQRLLRDRARIQHVLAAAFASAVVPLLVAAKQGLGHQALIERGGFSRIHGTFLHPNPFGIYLAFMIVMGAALLLVLRGVVRFVLGGLVTLCGVFLLLTYTRTAWVAAFLGVLLVVWLLNKRLLPVLLGLIVVVAIAVPSVGGRFSDLQQSQHLSGTAGNSLVWRVNYWTEALPLANRNPITGIGLKMIQQNTEEQKAPHNDFVRAYVEMGVIGLFAYVILLAALVRAAARSLKRAGKGFPRGVAAGYAGCVFVFLVVSVVSNVISQVVLLWYFVAFAAASMAAARISQPSQSGAR